MKTTNVKIICRGYKLSALQKMVTDINDIIYEQIKKNSGTLAVSVAFKLKHGVLATKRFLGSHNIRFREVARI